MSDDVNALLMGGGGPPAFSFKEIGATAKGRIIGLSKMQQRDYQTQKPKFWDDGQPMMMVVVTIQDDTGEEWSVYLDKLNARFAVRDAVTEAGANGLEVGGTLAVQFTGEEPSDRGNPRKLFRAQYQPPNQTITADNLI